LNSIIGVPAIGGHPEKTWAPRTVFIQDTINGIHRPSKVQLALFHMTPISPAYSGTPIMTTPMDRTGPAWITGGIRSRIKQTRVLLYDHGKPQHGDTLKSLATRLLKNIEDLRRIEKDERPIFFVCHSTGGLIVKMALAEAQRSKSSVLGDCYGITFFATPHRGSSYLSRPSFSENISSIMHLSAPLPASIMAQLELNHRLLRKLDSDFKSLASELQVWTFFETEDTYITNEFHAPITSIKSALLNLRHEAVYPLLSDHADCAAFGSNNLQTKESYLEELATAIKKALSLTKIRHTDMNLEEKVRVEINGFYETLTSSNETSNLKLWSTSRSLSDFKRHGPAKLLEDRLSEVNAPPREKQYLRQNTRAPSLLPDRRSDSGATAAPTFNTDLFRLPAEQSTKPKRFGKDKNKNRSRERKGSLQQFLSPILPGGNETKSSEPIPSIAVVTGDTLPQNVPTLPGFVVSASPSENALNIGPKVETPEPHGATNTSGTHLSPGTKPRRSSHGEGSQPRPDLRHRSTSPSQKRRGSESAINTSFSAPFSRPDASKQRLVWIHVPFNNPSWVKVRLHINVLNCADKYLRMYCQGYLLRRVQIATLNCLALNIGNLSMFEVDTQNTMLVFSSLDVLSSNHISVSLLPIQKLAHAKSEQHPQRCRLNGRVAHTQIMLKCVSTCHIYISILIRSWLKGVL